MKTSLICWTFLFLVAPARADGMLIGIGGFIREESQAAFIEWKDGQERLYVATTADRSHQGPSLWIIPIPGKPDQVKALPVATMPRVFDAGPLLAKARENLQNAVTMSVLLDSGLVLPYLSNEALQIARARNSMTFSSVAVVMAAGGPPSGIVVHEHIEHLGMTLEILSAESTAALDAYLSGKGLPFKSADLTTLTPYLKQGHLLICAWSSKEMAARAMRIDFPSPKIYFPLRPSQVYKTPISNSIFVSGFAELPAGFVKPYVRTVPVHAKLRENTETNLMALTKVILDPNPATWEEDLVLEPGGSMKLWIGDWAARLPMFGYWLLFSLLGGLASFWLPQAMSTGEPVTIRHRALALLAGCAIGLSILGSLLILGLYREAFDSVPAKAKPWSAAGAAVVFGCLHFLICVLLFGGAWVWVSM